MKPFVKWAGGKRQLIEHLIEIIQMYKNDAPDDFSFVEPFVGGGAVFINFGHPKTIINDLNSELMNAYRTVRDRPYELMEKLDLMKHEYMKDKEKMYYTLRNLDRNPARMIEMSSVYKAARTIFLNKTCYNGLYRVNSKGEFNTPMGKYKNPQIFDAKNIVALSKYFNNKKFEIYNGDYKETLQLVKNGDIVYVDPPYDYGDKKGFTEYLKEGFTFDDFITLKKELDICIFRGASVIISNNATGRVIELFEDDPNYSIFYHLKIIDTNRTINSDAKGRKTGKEVIIMGRKHVFPQANSIEKIKKLIRIRNVERLTDANELMSFLNVTSYRQIHYYLTALQYLNIIDGSKKFTDKGLMLRSINRALFDEYLAHTILEKPTFTNIFQKEIQEKRKLDILEIIIEIEKEIPGYRSSTYRRRVSTVRKWIDWCVNILG